MKYNVTKLDIELRAAGIPIEGCDENGRIDFKTEATKTQKVLAEQIKAAHKPIWYVEQRRKEYPAIEDQLDAIYKWAKSKGYVIPGFTDKIETIKAKYPKE